MSKFVEVNTQELAGAALDWAVAQVEGVKVKVNGAFSEKVFIGSKSGLIKGLYKPSTDWSQCGPLIAKIKIGFGPVRGGWVAHPHRPNAPTEWLAADHPLVAICRAIVADKLGMVVSVPKELMP